MDDQRRAGQGPGPSGMVVVNVRRGEAYEIYGGRARHGAASSPLANGYKIGRDGDRGEVIRKWAYDFALRWRTEPAFRAAILACQGQRVGCFCSPAVCHLDVVKTFLDVRAVEGEDAALAVVACLAALPSPPHP